MTPTHTKNDYAKKCTYKSENILISSTHTKK